MSNSYIRNDDLSAILQELVNLPVCLRQTHRAAFPAQCFNGCIDSSGRLPEVVSAQFSAFDDALQRADWNWFAAVVSHDHLSAIRVPPFLMAALLSHFHEAVPAQDANDILCVADGESLAHQTVTSTSRAVSGTGISLGSNQSSSASRALAMASSSVSPADAQPGSSGKTEEYRPVSGSFSTIRRIFINGILAMI